MYIYELPFDVNKELCRLLDIDDNWKELAGNQMKYSPFHVKEIEQQARQRNNSPTHQLFIRWGQLNHKVEELFILLYHMRHVPALRSLVPLVDGQFHRLLAKLETKIGNREKKQSNDENGNVTTTPKEESLIPVPIFIAQCGRSSTNGQNSPTVESSNGITSSRDSSSTNGKENNADDELMKRVASIPKMTYKELQEATDNWSNNNLLGRGGFGQVFKCEWKHLPVAVKRLKRDSDDRNQELIREMILNQYRHDNILPLYGYSVGGPEVCLVYQLMAGGSLEHRLRPKSKSNLPLLTWQHRYRIALGVARGLQYLHNMEGSRPLIHGDIKPANILLDQCLTPKIGDFGLARKGPYGEDRTHVKVSKVFGTRPYLPDEYLGSRVLSPAVDVFSFGVVLLEMATAMPPGAQNKQGVTLSRSIAALSATGHDLSTLEDPALRNTSESNPKLCKDIIEMGLHCTKYLRKERPQMLEVYKELDAMDLPGFAKY